MHPIYNEKTRKATGKVIEKAYGNIKGTKYIDAAGPIDVIAAVIVIDQKLAVRNGAVIRCRNTAQAEETAIAVAAT